MKKEKYFKVKIGFNPDDFISISESELPMAIRAHVSGKVGIFQEGTVSGNNIISITPDFNRELGYHRDYQLRGEDYQTLGKARVNEYREFLGETTQQVRLQLSKNPLQLQ